MALTRTKHDFISSIVQVVWLLCFLFFCLVSASIANAKQEYQKQLEEALKGKYELAKVGIDQFRITKPGVVLVLQKDGVYANPSTDFGNVTTTVTDGQLSEPKGFGGAFFSKGENNNDKSLKAGETVYATRIDVTGDSVKFTIITCDTGEVSVKGNSRQIRYAATVSFKFPSEVLEKADSDGVKRVVDVLLLPQAEAQAPKTKTVEMGQTPDQVKSALGAPEKVIKLGAKEIYVYRDMKVVFMDGKVADVQ